MQKNRGIMKERIKELETEIEQFDKAIQDKNSLIQRTQNEIQQLIQGVLTRQGGIVELKKLLEKQEGKSKEA